jgi:hypothetical protein
MLGRAAKEYAMSEDISNDHMASEQLRAEQKREDAPVRVSAKTKRAAIRRLADELFKSNVDERPTKRRTLLWSSRSGLMP